MKEKYKLLLPVFLVLITIGIVGAAQEPLYASTIQTQNVEQNDFVWGTINVDTIGLLSITAWTNVSELLYLKIYNETGVLQNSTVWNPPSFNYGVTTTGSYKFKTYVYNQGGGFRNWNVSSNKQLSFGPKYEKKSFNIPQNQAVFFNINVNKGDIIFLDIWSDNSYDVTSLEIFDPIGNRVSSYSASGRVFIDYVAQITGTYTVKGVITIAYQGGTRTLSLTSNIPFNDVPVDSDRIVFVRGLDDALWYRISDGSTWGDWKSLGGIISSDPDAASLNGNVYVFVKGLDNALWYRTLTTDWVSLGGIITSSPGVSTWDGNIYVFVKGGNDDLWYRKFDGNSWSDWSHLGGILKSGPGVSP